MINVFLFPLLSYIIAALVGGSMGALIALIFGVSMDVGAMIGACINILAVTIVGIALAVAAYTRPKDEEVKC